MLLPTLLRNLDLTDHDEVLKAVNAALKKSKTDTEAQHIRTVALLKLDRFDDAIRAFDEAGDALKQSAPLDWAYALYKVGRLQEAADVANKAGNGRGLRHVLAQSTYRLERFDRSAEVYRSLSDGQAEAQDEESDLRINSAAVDAQMEWAGHGHLVRKKKVGREDLEAFETAFNAACACIGRGELSQGEVLLKRARGLCEALEELSEEEKKVELAPILVQLGYVLGRLGRAEEAEKVLKENDINETPDDATKHIAKVNVLATASKPANPYLNHRLFQEASNAALKDQPFNFQSSILRQNGYVIDLKSLKYDGVAKSTASYINSQSSPTTSASVHTIAVLNAAANANSQVGKAGLKAMLPLLEKRPNDVGLLLTIIHLYLLTNNHGSAITLLESFFKRLEASGSAADLDVRYAPGLIGTLVSLYNIQGRKSQSKTELAKAASYWRHKSKESAVPANLLRAAGAALLTSGGKDDLAAAGDIFTVLHDQDPSDRASTAGLIASYSSTTPEKIKNLDTDSLTPISKLISSIDASALENAGVPSIVPPPTADKKRKVEREEPRKAKKIRKSRLPKDYDPNKQVDPERWLPLRDRTYYKPKGKKGKKRAEGLTQGGMDEGEKKKEAAPVVQSSKKKQGKKRK